MPCYAVTITPSPHKRIGDSKVCYKNCSHSLQRLLLTNAFNKTIKATYGFDCSELAFELTPSTNLIHAHAFMSYNESIQPKISGFEACGLFMHIINGLIGYGGRHNKPSDYCEFRILRTAYDIDRWVEYMRKDTLLSFRPYQKQYL